MAKKLSEIGGFQPIQGECLVRMAYNVACWCVVIYRNNYLRKLSFWQVCSFVGLFDFGEYRLNFGPLVATNIVNMGFIRRTHGRNGPKCGMLKGSRPLLEGFVVTMHEGAWETGSQIPSLSGRGIWCTVLTSPGALWQQTPTHQS